MTSKISQHKRAIEVFNIDDGRGDFWLVIKDIGFKDNVNVAIDLEQAKELYTLLGQHLQDIEEETKALYVAMGEVDSIEGHLYD